MAEVKPFGTELGTVVDDYNYGGMSANEIADIGDSSISLESILSKPDAAVVKPENGVFGAGSGFGGTLQGIGSIAQAAAGVYDAYNKKKYQEKVFDMEQQRVAMETSRQNKQQKNYEKVFG